MSCRVRVCRVHGFSLIELVVAILIAGILAALALPSFNQPQIDATWFHEQVKAAVRYAQREAVAQRRCVFVSITPAQLALFYGDANCAITTVPLTPITGGDYALTVPSGVALSASVSPFSFNGLGQPGPSTGVTISVAGKTVTVTGETGYVR